VRRPAAIVAWLIAMLKSLYRSAPESLLARQLCPADAVPIQHLVVHCHRHLDEPAGEFEGGFVVRDRRAPIPTDIEAGPRDEVEAAEPRLDVLNAVRWSGYLLSGMAANRTSVAWAGIDGVAAMQVS
jgi:hypothetical protein